MHDAAPPDAPPTRHSHALRAGTLSLTIHRGAERGLFRIAERINPKRAFLFVSTVLGRHIPVEPHAHRAALHELAERIAPLTPSGPVFVMGFAETAVGIGAGVFDCLRARCPGRAMGYLTTTRFAVPDRPVWFTIEEAHSHAVDHTVLRPDAGVVQDGAGATLVLVDDETTTGKTFAELAEALRAQGLSFDRVILATLTDWSGGSAVARLAGVFPGAVVSAVSLLEGEWEWTPDADAPAMTLPPAQAAECPVWHPAADQPFAAPRIGLTPAAQDGAALLARLEGAGLAMPAPGARVLVIGAGEHVWQPFLVAEALAERGLDAWFITTTRSPIIRGETIAHKVSFADHYGLGIPMYMHNVAPQDWDRILFFTETTRAGVPQSLRRVLGGRVLGGVDVIDGAGDVHPLSETGEYA